MTPEQVKQIHDTGRYLNIEECIIALQEQGIEWNIEKVNKLIMVEKRE
jgi:hypothetical protein